MLFEHASYKKYLVEWIDANGGRGVRSRMAEALNCHTGYVSQVLKGSAHLSLEQAEAFNQLAGHSRDEAEYFLLLVQSGRAATPALRARLGAQIATARQNRLILRNRARVEKSLGAIEQSTYYSSWAYAAVHVLLTIPAYRTETAVSRKLGLPRQRVREVLEFLSRAGLAAQHKGEWRPGAARLFLRSDSPMIGRHHTNWRLKTIDSLEDGAPSDLHLSTVLSLSVTDIAVIKERLIREVEAVREIAHSSPEEEMVCFSLDFFTFGTP